MSKVILPPTIVAAPRRKEQRYFSEEVKRLIVAEIKNGNLTISEAARKYEVTRTSIYKWLDLYDPDYERPLKVVVEHQSDSVENKKLKAELAEAYHLIGTMQAKTVFLDKVIELADAHYETDLKKNFGTNRSAISGKIRNQKQ